MADVHIVPYFVTQSLNPTLPPACSGPDILSGIADYRQPLHFRERSTARRLLVFGDSLVLGIGAKGTENAHLLTQTIARTLAQETAAAVEWHSVGVNGGSVAVVGEGPM